MENFSTIIDYIARTNLFNFVIFMTIIILLVKKIDVGSKLEFMRVDVNNSVTDSETVKTESESRLNSIEESMLHIEQEIDSILDKSAENAKLVGEKIISDAEQTAVVVKENALKVQENNRTLLKNELLRRTSLASIEVAKKHIIDELSWNQGLHEKLIDESVDAIEGVEF